MNNLRTKELQKRGTAKNERSERNDELDDQTKRLHHNRREFE
jgi:hypothetical protein